MKIVLKICALMMIGVFHQMAWAVMPAPIPTIDMTVIHQLQNQFAQMQREYAVLNEIRDTQKGSYRRGALGLDAALAATKVIPGSWQDVVGKQRRGAYGSKKSRYDASLDVLPEGRFIDDEGASAKQYGRASDSVVSAMATGEAAFDEINTHLKNMRKLAARVDETVNAKDAQDLRNRIAVEQGFVQTAVAKVNVLMMHLQANLLQQQTNSVAVSHRYFNLLK